MNRSLPDNVTRRTWFRRLHRWLGIVVLVFVLLLAVSGIALNHAGAWGLDQRYVAWGWVGALYGIEAPAPESSFKAGGHRATLLGERLYFDGRELARDVDALAGAVTAREVVIVAAARDVFLLTPAGELIERLPVAERLRGTIAALGLAGERVVLKTEDSLFRFDGELLHVHPWADGDGGAVRWSTATPIGASELAAIETLYRGRGVTLERLLLDLHSGRLFARFGALLMDAVAILLILLGLSGLWLWLGRGNGQRR